MLPFGANAHTQTRARAKIVLLHAVFLCSVHMATSFTAEHFRYICERDGKYSVQRVEKLILRARVCVCVHSFCLCANCPSSRGTSHHVDPFRNIKAGKSRRANLVRNSRPWITEASSLLHSTLALEIKSTKFKKREQNRKSCYNNYNI